MGAIRINSPVPGPRSQALAAQAWPVAHPVRPDGEVFIASGSGAVVEDVDGNRFLDLTGGLGCLVVGHAHPRVVEAVRQQAGLFLHTDYSVIPYEGYGLLAERIAAACGRPAWKVAFFNSGAEAVENSVKVARFLTRRPGLACFEGAFHGRTNLTLGLTSREVPYKEGFGPFPAGIVRLPYPGLGGATEASFTAAAGELLEARQTAAVVVEPILGEGGFVVPPAGFLPALERLCRRTGTLLIADEIQCGYGRSGRFLAGMHSGVEPGMVLLAKSIASGLPLSAVAGPAEVMDALPRHSLGGTFVGNPVACAAGLAVLDVIEDEGLVARAETVGSALEEGWKAIAGQLGAIREVRRLGSLVGVEFEDPDLVSRLLLAARSQGVLAVPAGRRGEVVRHLPPLVITGQELEEALAALRSALAQVLS